MVNRNTQQSKGGLDSQNASIIVAVSLLVIGFVLYVWMEWATHSMLYSLPATAGFAAFFALPALVLLWHAPRRVKLATVSAFLLLVLVVRNVEWNSRKPFLRALDSLQAGMTVEQVDAAMRGFVRGPQSGVSQYGTIGFRHTDEGWGNADIGLVTLEKGKVIRVEYLPD